MKQATVKLPSGDHLVIWVQPGAYDFDFNTTGKGDTVFNWWSNGLIGAEYDHVKLPPGSWQLLGADPTNLTEEEAGEIVERHSCEFDGETFTGFKHYGEPKEGSVEWKYDTYDWPFDHATASIDSLAASLGISKPYVILKNVEK